MIVEPNSQLVDSILTNYRASDGAHVVSADLAVVIGIAEVERVSLEVAGDIMRTVAGAVPEFIRRYSLAHLAPVSFNFTVFLRAAESESIGAVRHEFTKRVVARFQSDNIKVP